MLFTIILSQILKIAGVEVFGYEVIDQGQMDLSFMESGRAPLLWWK